MRNDKIILFLVFLLLVSIVSAECEENMIDINNADLNELDELYGVGPTTAQNIIDSRPYDSIDDLINARGIGEIKLATIKSQGLACVKEEENDEKQEQEEKGELEKVEEIEKQEEEKPAPKIVEPPKPEIIKLNAQTIKTQDYTSKPEENNYAIYELIGFGILLFVLFKLRKKRFEKNEFR